MLDVQFYTFHYSRIYHSFYIFAFYRICCLNCAKRVTHIRLQALQQLCEVIYKDNFLHNFIKLRSTCHHLKYLS